MLSRYHSDALRIDTLCVNSRDPPLLRHSPSQSVLVRPSPEPLSAARWAPTPCEDVFSVATLGSEAHPGRVVLFRAVEDGVLPPLCRFETRRDSVFEQQWSADCRQISLGASQRVLVYDVAHQALRCSVPAGKSDVFAQRWRADGQLVWSGCRGGQVSALDLRTRRSLAHREMFRHSPVADLALLCAGAMLQVASADGLVRFFDLRSARAPVLQIQDPSRGAQAFGAQFRPLADEQGRCVHALGVDQTIRTWHLWSGRPISTKLAAQQGVGNSNSSALALLPNGLVHAHSFENWTIYLE